MDISKRTMRRSGFSIASLLLLMVVVAIFAAGIDTAFSRSPRVEEALLAVAAVGGAFVGIVVGVFVGLNQKRPAMGVVTGVFTGAIAGAGSGLLLAAPNFLPMVVVGALVMILFATVVRVFSG